MKSLLGKRLPGILAVGLVALAVGAASAPASAADAHVSGLTAAQKKAKAREIKKCKRIKSASKRKACIKKVNRKYNRLANQPKGEKKIVNLGDNFYSPDAVDLKVNDSIEWRWANIGGFEPHDVTLTTGPTGVDRMKFKSETTADPGATFTRQFTTSGKYNFVCSLHFAMTMTVQVSR
ncbi:MAG TPA: plastocyanin/azurin family copper-binding protein [Solirubrobacterales bacterium]|nr:plastocyanin/azurin family copper-binding protein [Solirubrobacterales bacterium]